MTLEQAVDQMKTTCTNPRQIELLERVLNPPAERELAERIPLYPPKTAKRESLCQLRWRHAALYITKSPKAEHDAEEWQAAMQALDDEPASCASIRPCSKPSLDDAVSSLGSAATRLTRRQARAV